MITDLSLAPHIPYVFHVKAWYSDNEHATFISDGVYTNSLAPELSGSWKIKETRNSTTTEDIDFTLSESDINVVWENVFRDDQAGLDKYIVSVGSYPGRSDIELREFPATVVRTTFSGLDLNMNIIYTTTVEACNKADICTTTTSDGLVVNIISIFLDTDTIRNF